MEKYELNLKGEKGNKGLLLLRISDGLERIIIYGGVLCVAVVVAVLLLSNEYPSRLAGNRVLSLAALALMLPGGILYGLSVHRAGRRRGNPILWLILGYVLLYAAQLFWVNRVYFYTGWDVGVMKYRVDGIVEGGGMVALGAEEGYSIYPNNLLLFYILCILEKIGKLLSMQDPYLLCIYGSCLCVNVSCFLGNLIIRRFTESGCVRGYYTLLSTLAVLFSPWIIIPYSDTYGMLFVMLGMWGLLCLDGKYLKWVVVAFASVIGYSIKPTCIFPLFAGCMTYGLRYLLTVRERWRELFALVGSAFFFWCAAQLIPLWIQHTYSFRLDPELQMPYTHYIKMGLNEETKGGYYHGDYLESMDEPDFASRKQAAIDEAAYRLRTLANEGRLGKFFTEKALVNFNDGTFAWSDEGGFFSGYIKRDNVLADLFLETMIPPDYLNNEGRYFSLYRTVMQTVWLSVLIGILFVGIDVKKSGGVNLA